MAKFPKRLGIHVLQNDIDEGQCRLPNKCMLKLAIKREIGGHGYVHVEGGVVSITRRPDYRERGILPRSATKAMIDFDAKKPVKPFTFYIDFMKTTKIKKLTDEDRASQRRSINKRKAARVRAGLPASKEYGMRKRLIGIGFAAAS